MLSRLKYKMKKGTVIFRKKFKVIKGAAATLQENYEIDKDIAVFLLVALTVVVAALIFIPIFQASGVITQSLKYQFDAENEARQTLAQIVGGVVVLFGVFLGYRRVKAAEDNVRVLQEGQITERFTRAVEQLGDDKIQIRLGGIYGLERIARERAERELPPLMDEEIPQLPVDIQAALTVIGRRELAHEDNDTPNLDLHKTDLQRATLGGAQLRSASLYGANLSGAYHASVNLSGAYLHSADFGGANLSGSRLYGANLSGANLNRVNLERAELGGANLGEASLIGANLKKASLIGANFSGASLHEADLSGASLIDTDLSKAGFVTKDQIDSAITNENTKLPDYLKT